MGLVSTDTRYVMLVEDNESDVELTLMALEKNNISNEIVVAHDGDEALQYLLQQTRESRPHRLPAVILLDLNMPNTSGLEVLRCIRSDEYTRRIPVVIRTSSTERQDMTRGYELGVYSYIQKPVDFNMFSKAVGQLGTYWLTLNESPETIT